MLEIIAVVLAVIVMLVLGVLGMLPPDWASAGGTPWGARR
jgi:hypothetical protein